MRQKDECRLFLESYRELRAEENRLWQRHQRLRAQATKITTQLSAVPGGRDGDRERLLAALADEDGEALAKHAEAESRRREIESFIDTLPTPVCRIVLRYRYVECMSWVRVTFALQQSGIYYGEAQIYRIHGNALREARVAWRKRKELSNGRIRSGG